MMNHLFITILYLNILDIYRIIAWRTIQSFTICINIYDYEETLNYTLIMCQKIQFKALILWVAFIMY